MRLRGMRGLMLSHVLNTYKRNFTKNGGREKFSTSCNVFKLWQCYTFLGIVSQNNTQIWGNPHAILEQARDNPKVDV